MLTVRASRLRIMRLGALVLLLLVSLTAVRPRAAEAQTGLCPTARALLEAQLVDSAVDVFDAAEEAGLPCGSGDSATAAKQAQSNALAMYYTGRSHEERGDFAEAAAAYRQSIAVNAESSDARLALLRVGAEMDNPSSAANPYAAAEYLAGAGRHDKAIEAAVDALTETGQTPSSPRAVGILAMSGIDKLGLFLETYRWWLLGALVLVAFVWTRVVSQPLVRAGLRWRALRLLPPRLKFAVTATDASGSGSDLSEAFAIRLGEELQRERARIGDDPRVVRGPDVPQDMPDLAAAPSQARFLAAAWQWIAKQNILTLRVRMLPESNDGVGCHMELAEPDGSPTRGLDEPSRIITIEPYGGRGPDERAKPSDWQRLVPLAAAWGFFAINSVQATDRRLRARLGTSDINAYGYYLAALTERQPAEQQSCYQAALEADNEFLEAHLNLSNLEAQNAANRMDALARLGKQVLAKIDVLEEASAERAAKASLKGYAAQRLRAVWYRGQLSLAVQQLNMITPCLSKQSVDVERDRPKLESLQEEIDLLTSQLTLGEEFSDGLTSLRMSLLPHAEVLRAGILDLNYKYRNFDATVGHRGLPLETFGCPLFDGAQHREDCEQPGPESVPRDDEAVEVLLQYEGEQPARIRYRLACIWARDSRLRGNNDRSARHMAVGHLRAAIRLSSSLEKSWQVDPDFDSSEFREEMDAAAKR
jgi:tetratricopeptide (TPR) repeat protein